jgi:hypothetical protein
LLCQTTKRGFGVRFEGTEGWIEFAYDGVKTFPEALKDSEIGPQEIHLPSAMKNRPKGEPARSLSYNHVRNFVDCVKSREDPSEPVEAGHRTASLCHLGNIAMKLKRKIKWDPQTEHIVGDDEAAAMLSKPMREPWTI